MKRYSTFDPDTYYVVTQNHVRIVRNSDKLTIPYPHLPEKSKLFRPEIQSELMVFYKEHYPLATCPVCGKEFRKARTRKYCTEECYNTAQRAIAKTNYRKPKTKTCIWCGKSFVTDTQGKFCSSQCKAEHRVARKQQRIEPEKPRHSHLTEKLKLAEARGMSYAEMQRQETLSMVPKVVV